MKTLKVSLEKNSYKILLADGIINKAGHYIKEVYHGKKIMVVTDENVAKYHLKTLIKSLEESDFQVFYHILPAGEKTKEMNTLPILYSEYLKNGITRTDLIVAFGGGVIGDIVGLSAATFLRGVPYVQIPTTLLAQVDSSVGGKVAADLAEGKNLMGVFYQPKLVLIDPLTLKTLEERYYRDGMGEVIKYACLFSKQFYNDLMEKSISETDMIYECCSFKKNIVLEDEFDLGKRLLLNFGHTLGHAVEQYFNFEKYSHGEAVGIGMYEITKISEGMGLSVPGTAEKVKEILEKYGLEQEAPEMDKEKLLATIAHDKKNLEGFLNIVLISEIGAPLLHETNKDFFNSI